MAMMVMVMVMVMCLLACVSDGTAKASPETANVPSPALAGPETVTSAYPPPPGSVRVVPADDFGRWIQDLPLRRAGTAVMTHDGRQVRGHYGRVVDMPMVSGDLQQCADALLRVRGEWMRDTGQGGAVSFYATSGDALPWSRYAGGDRPYVDGRHVRWRRGAASGGDWDGYLTRVFDWAGTISLKAYETALVEGRGPRPGDILVRAGSPGHAVLLVDVATRGDQTVVLFVESYMPAQDLHVEEGPLGGWWAWDPSGADMDLRTWTFSADDLRAWR